MHRFVQGLGIFGIVLSILMSAAPAAGQFAKQDICPDIKAADIHGNEVDLYTILEQDRNLVILFFFSLDTSEAIALKLRTLHTAYGGREIEIIAIGLEDDRAALTAFAESLGIKYYVIPRETLQEAPWRGKVDVLPTTLFVAPMDRRIERVLRGVDERNLNILTHVAENLYQQRNAAALQVAEEAVSAGEDPGAAREVKGYFLAAEGKLDEAEAEFGALDSKTGLAKVAYERGDLDKAIELADQAPEDGYAQTIKGQALLRTGQTEAAATALESATQQPASDWQRAETVNTQGRTIQQQGDTETAIEKYQQAVALDPYNVVALSNEGAAYRDMGELEKAETVLQRAAATRPDELSAMMLQQIQRELQEANDLKRAELVRAQITDLSERFQRMKDDSSAPIADKWTTRPLVLAFLPAPGQSPVFFERAGTGIALQREIEARLQNDPRMSIVERQMLDKLLQELNLGSSELASADTQRRLGQVLSASLLGFIDFAPAGRGPALYLRLVDTETTSIVFQTYAAVDERNPSATVDTIHSRLLEEVAAARELQGLIAEAADENAVIINLGAKHGVKAGMEFLVLADGDPIEVGGRVIAHRQESVAKLTVSEVQPDYALCKTAHKKEGISLEKEMKIKAVK